MGFNAEGGGREHRFATQDSHSELWRLLTTVKTIFPDDGFFLRAESFYNTSSYIDQSGSRLGRYGYRQLHTRSHGEAFLALVQNRFEGHGLYLLDEPEAALSPQRLLSLLVAIHDLVELDSQFILATHSPIVMAFPGAEIKLFDETGVRSVDYRDTEHYQITKQFINDPERMLKYLLEAE
jgi:predicted ATPase